MGMQWGTAGSFPAVYEELMVPAFFRVYAEDLLERAAPQPGERLLDLATGTGIVPRVALATDRGLQRIVGLDMTPGMLEIAKAATAGSHAEWLEGDALNLPFEAGEFDIVTCQQGLQFFPDRAAALAQMHRVLAPGGRVAVACWAPASEQEAYSVFGQMMSDLEPEYAGVALAPFVLGDPDELGGLLSAGGFEDVAVERVALRAHFASPDAFYRSFAEGSPFAFVIADLGPERVSALRAATLAALAPLDGPDGMHPGMVTYVATGRTPSASA